MWLDFNDRCQVKFDGNIIKFDKFTGKLLSSCTISKEGKATKTIPCNLVSISQDNAIWSYEETTPTYRELKLTTLGTFNQSGNRKDLILYFGLRSKVDLL